MTLSAALQQFYARYATFSGRSSRSAYWWPALIIGGISWILEMFYQSANSTAGMVVWGIILGAFALINILPNLAVAVRRLHDTGRGGGWIFINLIPFIGNIWFLILMILPSQGPNRFGD